MKDFIYRHYKIGYGIALFLYTTFAILLNVLLGIPIGINRYLIINMYYFISGVVFSAFVIWKFVEDKKRMEGNRTDVSNKL
ncbi:MAG TPA: hypothetical protein P5136_06400 [Methanofastidiosum sp.]|nr:hypothetical protein [Methanofastidiosum sp.]